MINTNVVHDIKRPFYFRGKEFIASGFMVIPEQVSEELIFRGHKYNVPFRGKNDFYNFKFYIIEPELGPSDDSGYSYFVTEPMYNSKGTKVIGTTSNGDPRKKMGTFYRDEYLIQFTLDEFVIYDDIERTVDSLYKLISEMEPEILEHNRIEYTRMLTRDEYFNSETHKINYELMKEAR